MKKTITLGLGLAIALAGSGCANAVKIRLPLEFKNGKQKQDPPITGQLPNEMQRPAAPAAGC